MLKRKLLVGMLMAAGSVCAYQLNIGIRIGAPPPARVVRVRPPSPGPEFVWVDGYWYPVNGRYRWHAGYWTRPPYPGAHWIGPHHDGSQYYQGYWEGERGRMEHDHRWDRDHDRDWRDHHDHDDHDRH